MFRYVSNNRNDSSSPEQLAEIASALSEPHRLRLLGMLSEGELCLCDLTAGIELVSSTVSNHMAVLKRAGLVESRKEGRWMHFRLADRRSGTAAADALGWTMDHLPESAKRPPETERGEGACRP
jgi:ArsR family transcriptional regulator